MKQHIQVWFDVTNVLIKTLESKGLKLMDSYLVGSQTKGYKKDSDFDSIILLSSNYNPLTLSKIKLETDLILGNAPMSYHYKIFDLNDFKNANIYDAYRFYDFKRRNISLKKSNSINKFEPQLDITSFSNSILIQFIHKLNKVLSGKLNVCEFEMAINKWYSFNNEINDENCLANYNFKQLIQANYLLDGIMKEPNLILDSNFLSKYYKLIHHEYINKSHVYNIEADKNILLDLKIRNELKKCVQQWLDKK